MKVARSSALRTSPLYPQETLLVFISVKAESTQTIVWEEGLAQVSEKSQ